MNLEPFLIMEMSPELHHVGPEHLVSLQLRSSGRAEVEFAWRARKDVEQVGKALSFPDF